MCRPPPSKDLLPHGCRSEASAADHTQSLGLTRVFSVAVIVPAYGRSSGCAVRTIPILRLCTSMPTSSFIQPLSWNEAMRLSQTVHDALVGTKPRSIYALGADL